MRGTFNRLAGAIEIATQPSPNTAGINPLRRVFRRHAANGKDRNLGRQHGFQRFDVIRAKSR